MGQIIIVLVYGIIMGFATQAIIENKGYNDNWFWWGFFFGIIALIVAAARPQCVSSIEMNRGLAETGETERTKKKRRENVTRRWVEVHLRPIKCVLCWNM